MAPLSRRETAMLAFTIAALSLAFASVMVAEAQTTFDEDMKQLQKSQQDAYEWQELICVPVARMICSGSSCNSAAPSVHLQLKRESVIRGTMSRCDSKGCDTYEASIDTAGIFTSIQPIAPSGAFVKVMGAQEYIEVATSGLTAHFSSGKCIRKQ